MMRNLFATQKLLFPGITDAAGDDDFAPITGRASADFDTPARSARLGSRPGGTSSGTASGTGSTATTTASTAAPAATLVTTAGSNLKFNLIWDSSVSAAPAGFMTDVKAAVGWLERQFSDNVTITINVGYGESGGNSLGSALGQSQSYLTTVSYSALVAALKNDQTSQTDASVVASLPASAPVSGTFWTTTAEAKALHLSGAGGTSVDGSVGFASASSFTYGSENGAVVAGATYDFYGTVLHEISEIMGRQLLTGATVGGRVSYDALDLMHYSAAGTATFSASTPGYFSIDRGATDLQNFNTNSGGDAGDWASPAGATDSFDAFGSPGHASTISSADLILLDAIGWTRTGASTPPPPVPAPTGVSLTVATAPLAGLETTAGLAGGKVLMTIGQVGGRSTDTFTYTLGGAGAGSFGVASANNVATLTASGAGAAGSISGRFYALTLTATDTTAGVSSAAVPVDVVVGAGSGDTISLAALSGTLAAARPTFAYGSSGNDTIDGAGMTGRLWFDGGKGADTLIGGAGGNDFLYGATSDSTVTAMDVIKNFHASVDTIDLTGIGASLGWAGQGSTRTTAIGGHAAGFIVSGGNTFLYVNASGATEALGSADMKIELIGQIGLTSANILHA